MINIINFELNLKFLFVAQYQIDKASASNYDIVETSVTCHPSSPIEPSPNENDYNYNCFPYVYTSPHSRSKTASFGDHSRSSHVSGSTTIARRTPSCASTSTSTARPVPSLPRPLPPALAPLTAFYSTTRCTFPHQYCACSFLTIVSTDAGSENAYLNFSRQRRRLLGVTRDTETAAYLLAPPAGH